MKRPLPVQGKFRPIARQQGIVLFVALIALVTMMLAAVALMRSVDTATVIAGNMAFKQAATNSTNTGIENAIGWIAANPASLINNSAANAANGYYASPQAGPLTDDGMWAPTNSAPAKGADIDINGMDSSGNTIRYIIERMCDLAGNPTQQNCLFGAPAADSSGKEIKGADAAGGGSPLQPSPMYRVTVRVTGPRNTVSFVQAFVY